jgi:hypothetical protein
MLTGTERARRIHHNSDVAGGYAPPMMRSVDEKATDPHWREGKLVLCDPVTSRQLLFADLYEGAPGRRSGERKPHPKIWG